MRAIPVVFAFAATAASQSIWVVDDTPGPGVHFTSLPAAVAAAANGDTLLVAAGSYEPFLVSGKALSIRGAGSAVTLIDRPSPTAGPDYVAIDAVPAGFVFRLSGVAIRRDVDVHQERLVLRGNGLSSGAVVLDHVIASPATLGSFTPYLHEATGMHLQGALVHAYSCEFIGGATRVTMSGFGTWVGHAGVLADGGSTLIAHDCSLRGGAPFTFILDASVSGPGLRADGATCRLHGCALRGGNILTGFTYGLSTAGAGLQALGPSTVTVAGGAGDVIAGGSGASVQSIGGNGLTCASPAVVAVHGPVTISAGTGTVGNGVPTTGSSITTGLPPLPHLDFSGVALGNGALDAAQPVTLSLGDAPPAAFFVLLGDLQPGAWPLTGLSNEPLLLSGSAAILSFGFLDASGAFTLAAVPASQLPYLVGLATHWQAFVWDPAAALWLGSNAALLRVEL